MRGWILGDISLSQKQRRRREIFLYLFFGGLTTVVNYVSFRLLYVLSIKTGQHNFDLALMIVNVLAWAISVSFAFVTNRKFVFCSKGRVFSEFAGFVSARVFSLIAFDVGLFLFAFFILESFFNTPKETHIFTIMNFEVTWVDAIKMGVQVFVVIANYILSKRYIFNKNKVKNCEIKEDNKGET